MTGIGTQPAFIQQMLYSPFDGSTRIDDLYIAVTDDTLHYRYQERIMRTSEHYAVGTCRYHRLDYTAYCLFSLRRPFGIVLHDLDEALAHSRQNTYLVGVTGSRAPEKVAFETAFSCQNTYNTSPGRKACRFYGRFKSDKRDFRVLCTQIPYRSGRSSIAGHNYHLAPASEQKPHGFVGQQPYLFARTAAIGAVFAVAQIDDGLVRHGFINSPPNAQSSETGVVHSYGIIVHRC